MTAFPRIDIAAACPDASPCVHLTVTGPSRRNARIFTARR
jgi:hypothetical protein